MKKLCFFIIGIVCFYHFSFSQSNSTTTETKEIYFRIIALKEVGKDSIHALLDGGLKHGISKGLTGPVKATYVKDEDRNNKEIGFASVRVLNDSETMVLIRPIEKYEGNNTLKVRKGDHVILKVQIPKLNFRSVFFDLSTLDIFFNDVHNTPFYTLEDLYVKDSKVFEKSILEQSAKDVYNIYANLKDDTSFNNLKVPLTKGRFIGKSIFDVMKDCSAKDIYTFLNYVKTYPDRYMGKNWKIAETFATWVMYGGYYSKTEVKDSVLAYAKNPTLLKKFLLKNKETIEDGDFIHSWIIDAQDEPDSVYEKSMYAAKLALQYLPKDNEFATYYYTMVTRLYDKDEFEKAIPLCDTSYNYFIKAKNPNGATLMLFQKVACLYEAKKYKDCLVALEKGFEFINNPTNNVSEAGKSSRTIYYYRLKGFCYYKLDEFKPAIENFLKAVDLYKKNGSFDNLKAAIYVQGYLAKIYKKQGENAKALNIYKEQLALYTKLNDKKNIADINDDIALAEFNLGNYKTAIDAFTIAKEIYLDFDMYSSAGYSQSNIGQAYWNLGKYDSAIAAHQQALTYRRIAKSNSGLGYSWEKIGELYKKTGEKDKALNAYDSSSFYYALAKDTVKLRNLYAAYGDVYFNNKEYQKAFDIYQKWHFYNTSSNDKLEMGNSLYWLAATSYYFNDDTSKQYSYKCLGVAKEVGDKNNEYYATTNLGSLAYKVFDYDGGNKFFNDALHIAKDLKNKTLEASLYRTIGSSYSTRLDFETALSYLNKAVALYDSLGDKSQLPMCYRLIGSVNYNKGDFYEARKYYDKAIALATAVNNRAEVGYSYSAITFLYVIQGELSKAKATADSCYQIFKSLNNRYQIAEAYFNMALVYEAQSDGINAIKYYKMADSLYVLEKDDYARSGCHTNMGAVLFYQADYKNALGYFEKASKFLEKINFVTEGHILAPINIGECTFYLNDYTRAEKNLLEGYKMGTEKKVGRMINISSSFLGKLYYETKKYDLSEKYLLESFAIAEKSNETDLYINTGITLGKLYVAKNDAQKGEFYFGKTNQFIQKIDNSKYTWWALYEYGIYFYNQSKCDSAVKYFKKAVAIVENESQNLFGGAEAKKLYNADVRKVDLYNKLVACLAKLGLKDEALFYADKGNVQAVKEQIEKAGIATNDTEKADALKKGNDLLKKKDAVIQAISKEKAKPEKEQNKQLIASLESVKEVAENDYENYLSDLRRKYPDLESYFSNTTNPSDFRNYIEYIPDSTMVVLYIINDNQLFIFTVTNKETGIKIIQLKQDINKQASRFLAVLRNPNNATGTKSVTLRSTLKPVDDVRGDFKAEAAALYDLLIIPIIDELKGKKNICIIPNGKLNSIPFQCLGTFDDKKDFHFLIENYSIFYTSKIDVFSKNFQNRKMENSTAVFGNPDKSLPGATTEANEIGKIVTGANVYVEEQATEDKAKVSLTNSNYVHFATHGVLDYEKFEDSYLLFAPSAGEGNDGKLTIKEINGISKQTTSLVVLSACETAVSKEETKGWYISPANAFLKNRVDAVLATLWKVPDETTNLLLQEFYANLKKGMSKAQALRSAQATVSQNPKYQHPFYWSAFVLYGNWK